MKRTATTRDVAATLGLRPATVQSYARAYASAGRIPFDLTPGGHRRYNVEEVVSALEAEQTGEAGRASRPAQRHWLADATELAGWARRRDSRGEFPAVIRTLIERTTPHLKRFHGRSGEGVDLRGWDLVVEATASTRWVPEGISAWELSTAEASKRKANEDFEERSRNPGGLEPRETAFMICMLRRCSWKQEWVEVKRRQGVWRDVSVYDADDLERWLEQAPDVHVQVTRKTGRESRDVQDLATSWARWSGQTAPRLPRALFVRGRDLQVRALNERLQGEPQAIVVRAGSEDEALAFTLAALHELGDQAHGGLETRTLIVDKQDAWDELIDRAREPLVLVPRFDPSNVLDATDAGHHVVFAAGPRSVAGVRGEPIAIPRLRRVDARAALAEAGLKDREAERLAITARRSLVALRRRLAVLPHTARPRWSEPEYSATVVTALLAGAWKDDVAGDREVLVKMARRPYEEVTARLAAWVTSDDPPVRRVGSTWYIADAEDALLLLQPLISDSHLERFRTLAFRVLTEIDPASDLPGDQRWAAALYGRNRRWSNQLRAGMADTLALLAARADEDLGRGFTGQSLVDDLVARVLREATKDGGGQLWAFLSDVLPVLAEASPRTFCGAVEAGLAGEAPSLSRLFDPDGEMSIFSSPTHTGILWALERLAWSPEHFADAVLLLARLAELDPGGQWANRPAESLREIYVPWHPQTSLGLDSRLEVLDRMRERSPDNRLDAHVLAAAPRFGQCDRNEPATLARMGAGGL